MMYLCQFGQKAMSSVDRVQTMLFHSNMTLATLKKIGQGHQNLRIYYSSSSDVSVLAYQKLAVGSED